MERSVRENPSVLSTSPSRDGSSGEFWVEFHKILRCNSVSQTKPPTADTLLTSATRPADTSPFPLLPLSREQRAKVSLADFPRTQALLKCSAEWTQLLAGKLTCFESRHKLLRGLCEGDISPWIYSPWTWTGSTGRATMRLSCVFLCVHSHTHKNQGQTWNMISKSSHLPLIIYKCEILAHVPPFLFLHREKTDLRKQEKCLFARGRALASFQNLQ